MRRILDNTPAVVYIVDAEGRYHYVNRRWELLFRRAGESVIGKTLHDIWPADVARTFLEANREVLRTRAATEFEDIVPHEDGTSHWYLSHKFPLQDSTGDFFAICGISIDITERKRAEEEVRKRTEDLTQLLASVSDYLWSGEVDAQGKWSYRYYSPVVEKITGRPPLFFVDLERWLSVIHAEDRPRLAQAYGRVVSGLLSIGEEEEYRIVRPDGSIRWVRDRVSVTRAASGFIRASGVVSDITERKRAEEIGQQSESRWKLLREQLPCVVWTTDTELRITSSDGAGLAKFGFQPGQLVGVTLQQVHQADPDAAEYMAYYRRALAGESFRSESEWRGRISRSNLQPLRDERGAIIGVIGLVLDITEQKQAEEAFEENRRRLQAIFENSHDAISLSNDTGRFVDNNPAACQLLGYSREELLEMSVRDITPTEDHDRISEFLKRTSSGDCRMVCKSGIIREIEYRSVANILPGIHLGVFRDITDRKQAEEKLRTSERRLAEAQRLAHVGHWDRDVDADRAIWSDEVFRIFGLPIGDRSLSLADVQKLVYPEDREIMGQAFARAMEGGPRYSVEYRVLRPDGTTRYVHSQGDVIRDEGGQPRRMFGTVQDITERRQAEDQLRESEMRFRTFVDHATDAFFVHDDRGTILDANQQACDSLGFTRNELVGMTPYQLDVGAERSFVEQIGVRLNAGESVSFDSRHRRKDGTTFPVEVRIRPFWQNGRRFAVSLARDITDRKRGEEALRTLSQRLVEVQESERRRIACELHDEIGQSLTGLKLLLEASDRGSKLEEARTIVNELMGRVRMLSLDLRPAMLDDLGLIPALIWFFDRYTSQTGVHVHFHHNAPDLRFPSLLETAAYRIIQEALTNVARYACVSEVTVHVTAGPTSLAVQIQDQGIGFDVSGALSSPTTGGLTGMRERTVLLGGKLSVQSSHGEGACVTAMFPLSKSLSHPGLRKHPSDTPS